MRNDKNAREKSYELMCAAMKPYCGRIVFMVEDKKLHDSVYIWLVCSREEDAGEGRHQWRGTYCFRIMPDGATFAFASEDLVCKAVGLPMKNSWAVTEQLLDRLVPNLPAEQPAA